MAVGRKPGTPKTGGRAVGSVNKKTAEAQDIAEKLGVNPFEILLRFAKNDWKGLGYKSPTVTKYASNGIPYQEDVISPELRHSSAGKAAEYLYPKRKAIEQTFSDSEITSITRTIITKPVER